MKNLGQHCQLFQRVNRFKPGNDGYCYPYIAAGFHKRVKFCIIKKHLRNDIICTHIDLLLQVMKVCFHVGRLKMLFRVTSHTDTEFGLVGIFQVFFQVNARVKVNHLLQKITGVLMAPGFGQKSGLILRRIAPQYQHIVDTQVIKVDQRILGLIYAEPAADQVWNGIHTVFVHDRRTYALCTRPLAHHHFLEATIRVLFKHVFTAMIGNIDERRLIFHQWIEVLIKRLDAFSLEGWQYFKRDKGVFRLVDVVDYFHFPLYSCKLKQVCLKHKLLLNKIPARRFCMFALFLRKTHHLSLTIYTKDLVKKYGSRTVVNHVSFDVKQGEIVGLLGPNGAGKTTSFYQVVGLVKPDEGEVFLGEQNITKLPMYKRAQMGIGYLPQEASVFRKLSVEDNISAVLEMTKLNKTKQKEKLESLLEEFRLTHVRKNNGDTLSGGERRRTEIARALAVDPKFVLLDEPFAGVDPIAVEDIQSIVAKLKFRNIGILITDHNVNETLSICDRAYLLIDGKIFKHGTAEELASDEQVRRLYLGRNFELKRKDYLHDEAKHDVSSLAGASSNDPGA